MNDSITYINLNNFIKTIDENDFSGDYALPGMSDPIRYFARDFWTLRNDNTISAKETGDSIIDYYQSGPSLITLVANKTKFLNDAPGSVLNKSFSMERWKEFVDSLQDYYGQVLYDNSFIYDHPVILSNASSEENNANYIKIKNIYNFFSNEYESLVSNQLLDVKTLPGILSLVNKSNTVEEREQEKIYKITYSGLISDELSESFLNSRQNNENLNRYFNSISKIYYSDENKSNLEILKSLNEEFLVDGNTIHSINNLQYIPFPFYADIRFSNESKKKNDFKNILVELPEVKKELIQFLSSEETDFKTFEYLKNTSPNSSSQIKVYDLKKWLQNGLRDNNFTRSEELSVLDTSYRSYRHVEYSSVVEKIKNNILPTVLPRFDYKNREKHQEILFYKIVKKQFGHDSDAIVQTIWIDPSDSEQIRYIDSQLKYSNEYYYNVYAYILNIGVQYSYFDYYSNRPADVRINHLAQGTYNINFSSRPTYEVCELEIGRISSICTQTPYAKPNVQFFKQDNRIGIRFVDTIGDQKQKYRILEDEDFKLLENVKKSQQEEETYINFKQNIEANKKIQIFRSTTKPKSYMSFQGKKYKTVSLNFTNTLYDSIVPGIKYYYTFRYLNDHDCPSNPSDIYELEIVDNDGHISLVTSTIDVDLTADIMDSKKLKRYLLIRPSLNQLQIKKDNILNTINDVDVGPNGPKIWNNTNKNFILKITSKKSKRIIEFDLNSIINRKNK